MKKATTTEAENRLHYNYIITFILGISSQGQLKEVNMYTCIFAKDLQNLFGNYLKN